MTAFVLVFAALSAIILVIHVALSAGVAANLAAERRLRRAPAVDNGRPPTVAAAAGAHAIVPEVIVAARNEAATLPRLLAGLEAQTRGDVRFLLVDDRSDDASGGMMDEFCRRAGARARVIHNVTPPSGLTGKQAALDLAFQQASGDVLLFTDGDCEVPPCWAEEMLRHFADERVGVVLGRIELPESPRFLEDFQAFEQPLLNQYNFGSAGIGLPTGCFGNNMAVRARAVKEVGGGFHALGFSVTEDATLLDAVRRLGSWKVSVCSSREAACLTRAHRTWGAYVDQHTRWNAGGLFSADLVTSFSYIFVVLIYLVGSLLVLPLGFLDWRVPVLSLNAFLSIGLLAFAGGLYEGKNRPRYYARLLPYLFFFGFFYAFITVRAVLKRPFDWKGSTLRP